MTREAGILLASDQPGREWRVYLGDAGLRVVLWWQDRGGGWSAGLPHDWMPPVAAEALRTALNERAAHPDATPNPVRCAPYSTDCPTPVLCAEGCLAWKVNNEPGEAGGRLGAMDYGKDFSDAEQARALAAGECPRCQRPAEDMRGVGFSADALRERRRCFWFNRGTFECNAPEPRRE